MVCQRGKILVLNRKFIQLLCISHKRSWATTCSNCSQICDSSPKLNVLFMKPPNSQPKPPKQSLPCSCSLSKLCLSAEQSNPHSQLVFTAGFWIFQYEKCCNYVSYPFSHQCRAESSVPFRKLFSIIRKVSQKLFIFIREAGTVKAVNSASPPKTN